ncbi:MAG: imidazole glycerol phosphate synthase subunit HisF [Gemmatimonadales bacterium]
MTQRHVAIIDSGVANLAAVESALTALGVEYTITGDPATVLEASHAILPGVGRFSAGLETLRRNGLDEAVRAVHERGTPLLAVCLGMQMLGGGSDESPDTPGLGIVPGQFRRLPDSVRVPHLGWNQVRADEGSGLPSGTAAFANSFYLPEPPSGWSAARTTHGTTFVSMLGQGRTLACQFHPELSGPFGMGLIRDWLSGEVDVLADRGDSAAADAHDSAPLADVHDSAPLADTGLTSPATGTHKNEDEGEGENEERTVWREVAPRIVPCLDVKDGRVVKGIRFQNLRDAGDPADQAGEYERQGADEIVILDIGASHEARETQRETVRAVRRRIHIPLTVGGGVRTVDDARGLLAAGADKVSVNTAAVRDPSLLERLSQAFGTQCVVLAIDARRLGDSWDTLVVGGREPTGIDAIEWGREGTRLGAGEILLTSWDRDGTREGCDVELLEAMREAVDVPVIASGGIGTPADVATAFRAGADAVLAASVFHDGDLTVGQIKTYVSEQGLAVRP